MKANFFLHALRRIISTTHLYAAAFGSITPLLQTDHFKCHGYTALECSILGGPNMLWTYQTASGCIQRDCDKSSDQHVPV